MSDDASFDPRFAPEFQRGFPQADGARDASRTSPYAPGRSGAGSRSPVAPASSHPNSATTSGLGERRRARGGATARELPGQRTEARSLISMPPEEAARLSPYAAADAADTSASPSAFAPVGDGAARASASATPSGAHTYRGTSSDSSASVPAARPDSEAHTGNSSAPTSTRRRISPWRNPWLYVLFAAGAAVTVAGVSLTRWSLFMMYSPLAGSQTSADEPVDYAAVQVAWILGPTLVIVGGATLMGALFFVAASWLAARPLLPDAADDAVDDTAADGHFAPFDVDGGSVIDGSGDRAHWQSSAATFVPFDQSGSSDRSRAR